MMDSPLPSATTLRCLARLLGAPDDGAQRSLRRHAAEHPWLSGAVVEMAVVPLDRWRAEHTRLFVSGYPRTACPPFESAYRHGRMGGPAVHELEDLFARNGLAPDGMPADFLGALLDLAGELRDRPLAASSLAELWSRHLALWVPDFAADLDRHATLRVYRDLAARLMSLFPVAEVVR